MTVCFTASEVHTLGGVPQFLARYAERLRAAGVDVHVLAGSDPDGGPPAIEGLRPVAGLGKGFTARGAWAMARAINKLPRDTLLVGNSLNAAFVTAVTARLTGRRSLFFAHGLTSRYHRGLAFVACRAAELVTAACADAVVVLNADDARTLATARRVVRFAHGVEIPTNVARSRPAVPLRLLCVARHEPQKNIGATLRALAQCRRPLRLTIVGEGALFARHRDLVAELGLADRFELIARRAPGDIPWAEHDAFLLCSLSEGMPLSLLEAMAHGLPAIVTNTPGLGGLVGHGRTGAVLPALTGEALDEAMTMISDRYDELSRAARSEAVERHDIRDSAARLAEILRAAARGNSPFAPAGA